MQSKTPPSAPEAMNTKTPQDGKKQANNRQQRLKKALRANLRRRKADSAPEASESEVSRGSDAIGVKLSKQ